MVNGAAAGVDQAVAIQMPTAPQLGQRSINADPSPIANAPTMEAKTGLTVMVTAVWSDLCQRET